MPRPHRKQKLLVASSTAGRTTADSARNLGLASTNCQWNIPFRVSTTSATSAPIPISIIVGTTAQCTLMDPSGCTELQFVSPLLLLPLALAPPPGMKIACKCCWFQETTHLSDTSYSSESVFTADTRMFYTRGDIPRNWEPGGEPTAPNNRRARTHQASIKTSRLSVDEKSQKRGDSRSICLLLAEPAHHSGAIHRL
jgi:hypothetical protein